MSKQIIFQATFILSADTDSLLARKTIPGEVDIEGVLSPFSHTATGRIVHTVGDALINAVGKALGSDVIGESQMEFIPDPNVN